ncbi:MAG TPA: TA system VapC family ribonuclease toxin [Vicinamibacterales bacterium]|nr:TA system VapC family ribonuclease toxin [Vicinamibacterales bacterium]
MKLIDVNVWLAAVWDRHVHHSIAKAFVDAEDDELAFCRATEMAVLRLLTNPAVMGADARTRRQAWDIVLEVESDPRIRFLPEPRGLAPIWIALSKRDDTSHLLWTDDYLAAFAQALEIELVTLDRRLHARYPSVNVRTLPHR